MNPADSLATLMLMMMITLMMLHGITDTSNQDLGTLDGIELPDPKQLHPRCCFYTLDCPLNPLIYVAKLSLARTHIIVTTVPSPTLVLTNIQSFCPDAPPIQCASAFPPNFIFLQIFSGQKKRVKKITPSLPSTTWRLAHTR